MPEHVSLFFGPYSIDFYIYVDSPNSVQKANDVALALRRLPLAHTAVLFPIVVMEHKPGAEGRGGGTYTPSEVRTYFTAAVHEERTGVPNADIQRIFADHGSRGLIAIPRDRWERDVPGLLTTVFHEIGHCVHLSFQPGGIIPSGLTLANVNAVDLICGGSGDVYPRMTEVYARYMCRNHRIAQHAVAGESVAQTNERLIGYLRSSRAFRTVLEGWNP